MTEKPSPPTPFTWTLRTIQALGALLALAGLGTGAALFRMVQPEMASYSASALGLGFLALVLPLLGLSSLLLLPSTALLCLPAMRTRFSVKRHWFALWCLNLAFSAMFLASLAFVLWAFLTVSRAGA